MGSNIVMWDGTLTTMITSKYSLPRSDL